MNLEEASKKYSELINNAISRECLDGVIYEKHHIKPKSLFPECKNDKNNIVKLTIFEHILAHYYLCFIYNNNNKMLYAFGSMTQEKINKLNDVEKIDIEKLKEYSTLREEWYNKFYLNEEIKTKISNSLKEYYKNNPEAIELKSEKTKQRLKETGCNGTKISNSLKEYYKNNPEAKYSLSKRMKGKPKTEKMLEAQKEQSKAVVKYSLNGAFLEKYDSINEAARKNGVKSIRVSRCCRGLEKTVSDNIYRFYNENVGIDSLALTYEKEVAQIKLNSDEVICVFRNINRASVETGISRANILKVIKGERKQAGNFKWKYAKDLLED